MKAEELREILQERFRLDTQFLALQISLQEYWVKVREWQDKYLRMSE